MWCHVKDETELPNAHSSIVDATAQFDIVNDDRFLGNGFHDKPVGMVLLEDVWKGKEEES